jgi:D-alanine-D-alanine ligase
MKGLPAKGHKQSNKASAEVLLQPLRIWVLAPSVESTDPNIQYYYDFSQSIAEYSKVFNELEIEWSWQPVTLNNYKEIIESIELQSELTDKQTVLFNLCDGDEINGAPGISVIRFLKEKGMAFTGSDENFYYLTTSKILMKKAFDKAGVPTPAWKAIYEKNQYLNGIFKKLGTPIIVKPAVSGGSMGVGVKNVVENKEELLAQINRMFEGYRGWNLAIGGVLAEEFIKGPEYTVLIVGDSARPEKCIVYPPVERVFHPSLPEKEQFLSFDRLWEIYEEESPMPNNGNFYEYMPADEMVKAEIMRVALDAYCAVQGKGYTRIDLRQDKSSGKIYVLEVNAQCGLSEDENYTSIGAILRFAHKSFSQLVMEIITDALDK